MKNENLDRRKFMGMVGLSAFAGSLLLPGQSIANPAKAADGNINHIGPMEGYTPQIGTLISMLDWISNSVINATKKLTVEQLDRLHDKDCPTHRGAEDVKRPHGFLHLESLPSANRGHANRR